jgi:hypothetical protein
VTLVNELRLEQADPDTKGDLFEHVLRQIKHAGELGQFRTFGTDGTPVLPPHLHFDAKCAALKFGALTRRRETTNPVIGAIAVEGSRCAGRV